jgi:hypothetical protein
MSANKYFVLIPIRLQRDFKDGMRRELNSQTLERGTMGVLQAVE